jgi:hypothetical protein
MSGSFPTEASVRTGDEDSLPLDYRAGWESQPGEEKAE